MNKGSTQIAFKALPSPEDIELIIFDLGGVLLDIDYSLTQQAFAALGLPDVKALYSKAAQSDIFDRIETGDLSPAEFRDSIRAALPISVEDADIDLAWNALIEQMPIARLQSVIEQRRDFRTCLLSNTNEIHISCFEGLMQKQGVMDSYRGAFEHIFYSSRIGQRKPNRAAFHHVLKEMKVEPSKSLFFDDSIQHIEEASAMGVHSYHLEVGREDISDILIRFRNGLA